MTTDESIIDALRNRKKIVLTAKDVAALTDGSRSRTHERLAELEAEGRVASQKAGQARVWYLPEDLARLDPMAVGDDDRIVIPTYIEYLHKPVDERGRVTVHLDYAHKTLTLALLDPTAMRTVAADEWDYTDPMAYHEVRETTTLKADDRGRVKVGKKYAGREISIALLEVKD